MQRKWRISLIVCALGGLAAIGVFLSFVAHFTLLLSYGSFLAQLGVSVAGLAILTGVAYYGNWSKKQDKPTARPMPQPTAIKAAGAPGS